MSRGPGKIERAIEVLLRECPDDAFSVEDIADRIYVGVNRPEKRHRVSVLRAAKKVCERMTDWTWYLSETRGGTLVFWNRRNVMSYATARLKTCYLQAYRNKAEHHVWKTKSADAVRALIEPGGKKHHLVVEGGTWWRHVQLDVADLDNDASDRTLHLRAEQDEDNKSLGLMAQSIRSMLGR